MGFSFKLSCSLFIFIFFDNHLASVGVGWTQDACRHEELKVKTETFLFIFNEQKQKIDVVAKTYQTSGGKNTGRHGGARSRPRHLNVSGHEPLWE